jgi:hypothetical protein
MAEDAGRNRGHARQRKGNGDGQWRGGASRMAAMDAMRSACAHLRELTGKDPEAVIRIEPDDDYRGWRVVLEVLELKRIPDTTDLLASYELQLDQDCELIGYRRIRRYARAEQGEEVMG